MTRAHLIIAALPLLCLAGVAQAQTPAPELTPDQKGYIVYDRCMLEAAMKASYGAAKDSEIYGIAKQACTAVRSAATAGQEGNKPYIAALDAADADKAKNFPAWIKGVRERRRVREMQSAKP